METSSTSASRSLALRSLVVVALAVLAYAHLFTRYQWSCPIGHYLHVPCPTCGVSRALYAVLHRDFHDAFVQQPLIFFLIPYLGALVAIDSVTFVREGRVGTFLKWRWARVTGFLLAAALFVIWVVRFLGYLGGPRITS